MSMKKLTLSLAFAGAMLVPMLYTAPAQAQATRTWVSGVGDDANPCSRTAPCKTWAGAISKTAPGGEIDALDPGGFGAVTVTKSITLDGGGGQVASTLVAGTPGIVFAGQPTDVMIIRNLRLDGLRGAGNGNAGTDAIRFVSGGFLSVENCDIFGFNNAGISVVTNANATLNVIKTTITNTTDGINMSPGGGTVFGEMDHTTIQKQSGNGITTNTGNVIFTVTNSNILNAAGVGVNAGGGGTVLGVNESSVSSNNTAFSTSGGGGKIRISRNVIYDNNNNFNIPAGTIDSSGDNDVAVNGAGVPNGTITKQ